MQQPPRTLVEKFGHTIEADQTVFSIFYIYLFCAERRKLLLVCQEGSVRLCPLSHNVVPGYQTQVVRLAFTLALIFLTSTS